MAHSLRDLLLTRYLIIDGAMGTMIQNCDLPDSAWDGLVGCSEILNVSSPETIVEIHQAYLESGADITKTNTFGAMPWVLEEYDIAERAQELARVGAELAKKAALQCAEKENRPCFVAGSLGPGTKLPSLGHIDYDSMKSGYGLAVMGLLEGGVDCILLETCQDPLQIKCALHACSEVIARQSRDIPILVSVTIELSGTMLIGTDIQTLHTILEPFDIFTLGLNCGTGPDQAAKHIQALSQVCRKPISVHSNAGLPENRGGCTFYPMGPEEFAQKQAEFAELPGVALLGGCCGTTPEHIRALVQRLQTKAPIPPAGESEAALASLFQEATIKQNPAPLLIGERSNATGSKAFRELLLAEDLEGVLSVGQKQVRTGAHVLDVSVGFAGRDESDDMNRVMALYAQKIPLPLMVDSTLPSIIEIALKHIGGRPIINSANLEDGIERFDAVCALAKRFGCALVCLTIDEEGMAKTRERKIAVAQRMAERAVALHGLQQSDLVFDVLTFTVGSGDEEYFTAAIETIEAIRALSEIYPESGTVLGLSNISFGLEKTARVYLNSVFLHHCVQAGMSSAIVNTAHLLPYARISEEDREACEALLFNETGSSGPLFAFIEHFKQKQQTGMEAQVDEAYEQLSLEEKIKKLLLDGDKERMLPLLEEARTEIAPEKIVNEILIDGMKVIGELFGNGDMQLPFVLQSAEVMKAAVDQLQPHLPKTDKASETTLVLGTVKGDVHDVGKNLVDIILSNNGYKVINIGIKADIEDFIRAYEEHSAHAMGMSGLLVKSTQVMRENLLELKKRGINVPVLLGGAALNRAFIEEYCKPEYGGEILYCKDAFDGILAMECVEKEEFQSFQKRGATSEAQEAVKKKTTISVIEPEMITWPAMNHEVPKPPFWGRREFTCEPWMKELAFEWINHNLLFKQRWGYAKKKLSKEAYEQQKQEVILPAYERLRAQFLDENLFQPVMLYGYWNCHREGDALLVLDREGGELERFVFPRQGKPPHRALGDFFYENHDVVALSVVSSGPKISAIEQELYNAGQFGEYYLVHGLGVELAEALAEMLHKQIRIELGITDKEQPSLRDVVMNGYHGCRYSPGYPACPDLEQNRQIFNLLKPEDFGVTLTSSFQIVPEQSTCAIITHHPEANYYNI